MTVTIRTSNRLTADMDRLRCEGFLDPGSGITSMADPFDPFSTHITLWSDTGELIGTARLTERIFAGPGLIDTWTRGKAPQISGTVIDVSRIVVDKRWRRRGIYKLLVSLALVEAERMGADKVVMVVDIGLPAAGFLGAIGFAILGPSIQSYDIPSLPPVDVNVVTIDLNSSMPAILATRDTVLQALSGP